MAGAGRVAAGVAVFVAVVVEVIVGVLVGSSASSVAGCGAGGGHVEVHDVLCDIVVAGGSTASLAAAITAAEADPAMTVCFTEITDWPGGQMTAGGVPAIDFGGWNKDPRNQAASFRDFFNFVSGNPGACWVSIKCYEPDWLMREWIMPRLNRNKNLRVFLRTAVVATHRNATTGDVIAITAVQRTPRNPSREYSARLSEELHDWYSPTNSDTFIKTVYNLTAKVFVEATEFGDVLATSGVAFSQGIEIPEEQSWQLDSTCGQAATLTFYMTRLASPLPSPPNVPRGSAAGEPFSPLKPSDWRFSWTYRRSYCAGNRSLSAANVGDVTQQNLGNDLDTAYLFLPLGTTQQQRPWHGGINTTALRMLEDRAYGYFWLMRNSTPTAEWRPAITLNHTTAGTRHGLSKMPYLRDTRRAVGLGRFRLTYAPFNFFNASRPEVGYRFEDTVALGNYNDDTHRLLPSVCSYPSYLANHTTKPYYIPFRALTVDKATNLLVAGKTMAQTFHANGATRLHPSEWSSGVAAGGAAVLMARNGWSTRDLSQHHIKTLQAFLNSTAVGQPLEWTPPHNPPPAQMGFSCELGRCIGVDRRMGHHVYNSSTCDHACQALAPDEWLAYETQWSRISASTITSLAATILKKSIAQSSVLPSWEKLAVPKHASCTLITQRLVAGHYLCRYSHNDTSSGPKG